MTSRPRSTNTKEGAPFSLIRPFKFRTRGRRVIACPGESFACVCRSFDQRRRNLLIGRGLPDGRRGSGSRVVLGTFACTTRMPEVTVVVMIGVIIGARPVQGVGVGQSLGKVEVEVKLVTPWGS